MTTIFEFFNLLWRVYDLCITEWNCGDPDTPEYEEACRIIKLVEKNVIL